MTKLVKSYSREQYHLLMYLIKMQADGGILPEMMIAFNAHIARIKKRIRNIQNREAYIPYGAIAYYDLRADAGYALTKTVFDYVFDEEEKQEYIKNNWCRCCSPYDCSGEWFTQNIEIYTTKDKTFVYEWSAINV